MHCSICPMTKSSNANLRAVACARSKELQHAQWHAAAAAAAAAGADAAAAAAATAAAAGAAMENHRDHRSP